MPKKRKTRKEKLLHDQKVKVVQEITPSTLSSERNEISPTGQATTTPPVTFSLPASKKSQHDSYVTRQIPQVTVISTNEYGYLSNDLMRTALLTGAIVFAELLIRLFFVH